MAKKNVDIDQVQLDIDAPAAPPKKTAPKAVSKASP